MKRKPFFWEILENVNIELTIEKEKSIEEQLLESLEREERLTEKLEKLEKEYKENENCDNQNNEAQSQEQSKDDNNVNNGNQTEEENQEAEKSQENQADKEDGEGNQESNKNRDNKDNNEESKEERNGNQAEAEAEDNNENGIDEDSANNSEDNDNKEYGNEEYEEDNDNDNNDNKNEDEYDEDDDINNSEYENEDKKIHVYGKKRDNRAFSPEADIVQRKLSFYFERFIRLIAENENGNIKEGDEYFNVQDYIVGRYQRPKKDVSEYMYEEEREKVVVLLDTSGSCQPFTKMIKEIANVSLKFKDVDVYEAPNGIITHKVSLDKRTGRLISEELKEDIEEWKKLLEDRVILFFGDFDGGDSVVEGSFVNKVVWFSLEDRYIDMDEHDWCHYRLDDFNGVYYKTLNTSELIRAIRDLEKNLWKLNYIRLRPISKNKLGGLQR